MQTIFIKTIVQIILQLLIKSISTKQKYIITACIPKLLLKKILHPTNIKKTFCQPSIRMVNQQLNLSLNELRLIARHRNISDYENKSAGNLIKALRGPKPKL